MVYLKSVLVALAGMVAAAVLELVAVVIITLARVRVPGATVGFDPVSIFGSFPLMWLAPLVGFAGGFLWEYQRLRRKSPAQKA